MKGVSAICRKYELIKSDIKEASKVRNCYRIRALKDFGTTSGYRIFRWYRSTCIYRVTGVDGSMPITLFALMLTLSLLGNLILSIIGE